MVINRAEQPATDLDSSSEYLKFRRLNVPGRKTAVVEVISARRDSLLGQIRWYGAWRQYAFYPENLTTWNTGCLSAVSECIDVLMKERRDAELHGN